MAQSQERRYARLLSPGSIGTLHLPHRILMGSMHLGIEGEPTLVPRLARFYAERAEGGAALLITGGAAVTPVGGGDHMLCLTRDEDKEQLARVADAVNAVGGRLALQLFHSGRYASSAETGLRPIAPSAVECKLTRETPRAMTLEEITETILAFADAARFAKENGFSAVEIMGSEGYLVNEFLSPITNLREDAYGGTLEGRMRISVDVLQAIREAVGREYPVLFRMSGEDGMPDSTTREETLVYASRLEQAGADALNIGIGWHESRVPTVGAIVPRGGFAPVAAAVKSAVGIPVIGANRVNTPEVAEELISQGWLDFIAPARPWLADPAFANKILSEDRAGLNVCIACNQSCLDNVLGRPPQPASCLVNPRAGYEADYCLEKAKRRLRIAVVGGGPAGLEAARAAAQRGHDVTLFESRTELGGQFRMAARVPGKAEFFETLRYYEESLERLGVDVRLSEKARAEALENFDEVILATGVVPRVPDLPGIDQPHVVTYAQVLRGEVPVGRRIAIIGSGGIGCDVAHFLAQNARASADVDRFFAERRIGTPASVPREITILARSERVAVGVGRTTRWVLRDELRRLGVRILTNFACSAIMPDHVEGTVNGETASVDADQVIICAGQAQDGELLAAVQSRRYHVIGGARETDGLNAARAIREAFETAWKLGE